MCDTLGGLRPVVFRAMIKAIHLLTAIPRAHRPLLSLLVVLNVPRTASVKLLPLAVASAFFIHHLCMSDSLLQFSPAVRASNQDN